VAKDAVCGMMVDEKTAKYKSIHGGSVYYFCSSTCQKEFDKNPEKYVKGDVSTHHASHYGGYCGPSSCGPPARGIAWYVYFGLLILLVLLILFIR